jgi:RHS repeat-associated protein
MLETSPELCSARPRTGEPNATFGCTEATTPVSQCFHVHSINASVGPSADEATTATWRYQRNQQYSITAVTTSSGSVAERYAYTAYGQPTILDGSGSVLSSSAINNRYTYTGREWDQTLGLYHFRARWMSGLAGRFMGRDPIEFEGSQWNLYEFVSSRVTVAIDPFGMKWKLVPAGQGRCDVTSRETPCGDARKNGRVCNYHCYCPPDTQPSPGSQSHFQRYCLDPPPHPPSCEKWIFEPDVVPEPTPILTPQPILNPAPIQNNPLPCIPWWKRIPIRLPAVPFYFDLDGLLDDCGLPPGTA